jgi:phosphatidylethanolamine/phosphatidyl-N-methylethanolamine N-methyltransferase
MSSSKGDPAAAARAQSPLDNPIDVARLSRIYSNTAAFYDGLVAQHQAPAKLAALDLLARQPRERCLEVGVGTGWAFSRLVAATGTEDAVALDVAEGMVTVARERLHREFSLDGGAFLLADLRAMPFSDGTFDCLLATYTFEVLPNPDIAGALYETGRVLRPGGRLVAVNLTEGTAADAAITDDWKDRFASDPEFFGGARPLQLATAFERSGWLRVTRSYIGGSWPSEVLRAFRP